MTAVLVLNGDPPEMARLRELSKQYPVYAADGGARICQEAGVIPEWVAGDLDSALREEVPAGWTVHHHPEQTRTDFQKVMADLPSEVNDVIVLGGLGRRTDHLISNLMVAADFSPHLRLRFEGKQEHLVRITDQTPLEISLPPGSTLSLLPLSPASGVTTRGLRWNLENARMEVGGQLGQSNEVTGEVSIRITGGCLFAWYR